MEEQKNLTQMVEESLTLSRENNRLLKAMRRDALIGGIAKIMIWAALIIASLYFSMKFLEPYLGMLENVPREGMEESDYRALFDQYKDLLGR
jgi:hypothetical protein